MPIVTFWSNNEKTIGQTVAISMSAAIMAIDHNYKILLMSADPNDVSVEGCFGAQESNRELIKTLIRKPQIGLDSGINGLLKLSDSNRVTPEAIHDYTKIVFKNRLEVLYSPMNILDEKKASLMQELKNIMINASKYYDYVFVDLQKGLKSASQLEILELSDVIVANMDQGTKTIEQFLAIKEMQTLRNKVIWNICKYDNKSKYNIKNLPSIIRTLL